MRIKKAIAINGPNIYSYHPIIKLTVDLQEKAELSTDKRPDFCRDLLALLPSLRGHYCTRGYPGGFVERLREGTYLGHVLEHIALELQHLAGYEVVYGKTFPGTGPGLVEIVLEYGCFQPALFLAREGVKIVDRLLAGETPDMERVWGRVELLRQHYEPGPSTVAIINEARARGIPVLRKLDKSSLVQLGYGARQKRIQATLTSDTSCLAVDLAADKCLAKQSLDRAGIPAPWGLAVYSVSQALAAAHRLGRPVVVKPCRGNQGKGVSLNLNSDQEIESAFHLASRYSTRVMVEEYINGRHYRLLVVGGRLVAAARRLPAQITGDGVHTVQELVEITNRHHQRGIGHARPLSRIKLDQLVHHTLSRQQKDIHYLPAEGEIVILRENANLSTGGTAWEVTFKVHPYNAALAERAARVIGLDIAGIDLVAPDIGQPVTQGKGAVIEVNAAPGIRMHLYPSRGKGQNVARDIVESLFPEGDNGRIPIISVTGTNGKTTTAHLLAHLWQRLGKQTGLATTEGVFMGGLQVYQGDATGPLSARMILEDPTVEIAILETARGGAIRGGLGYDRSEVAVVTNISPDHFGQDGIKTIDDLVFIKSLIVETVNPYGAVVLNAEDSNVLKMIPRCRAPVVLFSRCEDNLMLKRHISSGGRALIVREGAICWAEGADVQFLLPVEDIPLTFGGLAGHHLQNAMAAASAALALSISPETVIEGLKSFYPSREHNPGRGNLFQVGGSRVLLDYGHNPAALEATLRFASSLGYRKLIGVVGVPGDRSSGLIRQCGKVCGRYLDQIIV
ncbi:MAG TPA: cyanophycin synthetase, partial [Firmicutes bacterium]|nr:cyanophycin synthetase [Bacillota bacterium]